MSTALIGLKQLPLHRVMLTCYQARQSGLLVCQRGEQKKVILLDKGNPKGCRSNIKEETLGYQLMTQGVITETDLRDALKHCEQNDGMMLGTALIMRGQLTPERLLNMLEQQLLMRIYDLFTWEEGSVRLLPPKETDKNSPEPVQLSVKTTTLILRGLIYAAEHNHAYKTIAEREMEPMQIIAMPNLSLSDFDLKPVEAGFLHTINGYKNLKDILAHSKFKPDEAYRLLYSLECLGMVKFTPHAAPPPPPPSSSSKSNFTPSSSSGDSGEFGTKVVNRLREIEGKDHFFILATDRNADEASIRKLYFKLAKEYHPDRLRAITNPQTRQDGEILFGKISDAYNTLVDTNKRQAYLATLDLGTDDATEKASKILESEAIFQRARTFLKQGELRGARELLEKAIALHDDEPEYHIHLGWCQYKQGLTEKNSTLALKGKQLIEKHRKARPNLELGYYYLGEIFLIEEDIEQAVKNFKKALDINPKSHESERQLRLIEMRHPKKKK